MAQGGQFGLVGVGRCPLCFSETCWFEPYVAKAWPWPYTPRCCPTPSPPEGWAPIPTPPTQPSLQGGISCFLFRLTVVCSIFVPAGIIEPLHFVG